MITVSVEEMRRLDAYTIEHLTSSRELMRRAAQGVYDALVTEKGPAEEWIGPRTAILCGSGNNAGDGYALAGILKRAGHDPVVYRTGEKCSEDGAYYLAEAEKIGVRIEAFSEETDLSEYDILIDCLLGTGFKGEPRGMIRAAIKKINACEEAYVVCVDINSGMDGDTGEGAPVVKSDLTVSIGYLKQGMFRGRADELIGRLTNVDIGIISPEEYEAAVSSEDSADN
ncbi:MAG: NAD(P)H-hydrate epimerase [Lachnospiraceae bacterium]|nr:NAD(P)H-hydrate epimerase [Lachnospiraceae bacterium]